jgi:hypothetical protein
VEDQDHTLVVPNGPDGPEDGVIREDASKRVLNGHGFGIRIERQEANPSPPPQPVAADVDEDAVKPGVESGRVTKARGTSPRSNQGVLRGILSFARVSEDEPGEAIRSVKSPFGQIKNALGRGIRGDGNRSVPSAGLLLFSRVLDHIHKTRLCGETVLAHQPKSSTHLTTALSIDG